MDKIIDTPRSDTSDTKSIDIGSKSEICKGAGKTCDGNQYTMKVWKLHGYFCKNCEKDPMYAMIEVPAIKGHYFERFPEQYRPAAEQEEFKRKNPNFNYKRINVDGFPFYRLMEAQRAGLVQSTSRKRKKDGSTYFVYRQGEVIDWIQSL